MPIGSGPHVISNPVEINVEPGIATRAALVKKYLPGCELRTVRRPSGDYESMDEVLMTPGGQEVDLASVRGAWSGTTTNPVDSSTVLAEPETYGTAATTEDQDCD